MFLAVFPLCFPAMAQDDIARSLVDACSRMDSVKCGFIQRRHLSMMDEDIVSKGRMSYRKPDSFTWEYTEPERIVLEMDGAGISMSRGDGGVTDVSGNKMYRELAKLLVGAVSGELIAGNKVFTVNVVREGGVILARMIPNKGDIKRMWTGMTMRFDPKTFRALGIDIEETGGDMTYIEFRY